MARGSGYRFPVPGAKFGRLDDGIDYQGKPGQYVQAVGRARVDAVKADPGGFGQAVYYTLLNGPAAGREIYVGHAQPDVKAGQIVGAGSPIATLLQHPLGNATVPGWTETGWAQNGTPMGPSSAQSFYNFLQGKPGALAMDPGGGANASALAGAMMSGNLGAQTGNPAQSLLSYVIANNNALMQPKAQQLGFQPF